MAKRTKQVIREIDRVKKRWANGKKFGNKWFVKAYNNSQKSKAQKYATIWRKKGYNARVVRERIWNRGITYVVYLKYAGNIVSKKYGVLKKGTRKNR